MMIMATFIEYLLYTWLHAVCFTCVTPLVFTPTFRTAGHGHTLRVWVTDHHHMPSASSQGRVRVASPGGLPSYSVIFAEGRQKPDILRTSCSFSMGGKRGGFPFTD